MSKIMVIFIGGGTSLVDKVINAVSHGKNSHVAIQINGYTVEALGEKDEGDKYPGVWEHDLIKYANDPNAVFIGVDIPDIESAKKKAKELIGTLYGYVDCVNGGIYDLTGKQCQGDGEITANCSETVTRILRAGGFNVLPGVAADCITPNDLYRALT